VWVFGPERAGSGKGWGQQLVGNGAVDSQHGTREREFVSLARKATTPSKGILHLKTPHNKYCTLYILNNTVYIKNKRGEGISKPVFILGPVAVAVCYHSGGSMKLNACNLLLAHMVYYNLNTILLLATFTQ
jgi:hypothetical protein